MTKTTVEPSYGQIQERLEGFEVFRDWLNISSGRCNIQIAGDLRGLIRDLNTTANTISGQIGAATIDVRGIDRRLGIVEERFNGLIHLLGRTVGVPQDDLNKLLGKIEKLNKDNLLPELVNVKKILDDMNELKPENHHVKSSFKGKIDYTLIFKSCIDAYLKYKEQEVLLPENTSSFFRHQQENPLTPGENFILGFGSAVIPHIRECIKALHLKPSSNLENLEGITKSLKEKLLQAQKDRKSLS